MTINAAWHKRHVMPRNATVEQRIVWHRAHQEHCACRPIPSKLVALMRGSDSGSSRPRAASVSAAKRGSAIARPRSRGLPRSSVTSTNRTDAALRGLLAGGDRRSVAQSERARVIVHESPARVSELAALAKDRDWLVSMRALDLLEKLAHERPDWVQPHKRLFIGPLAESSQWEIRLQIVRALPLLKWTSRERKRAVEILRRNLDHPQKFVRAWALDSLAMFAQQDRALIPLVANTLDAFDRSGSKALVTRARHIRARLHEARR